MASFYGNAEEVNHFLMPHVRNLVQYLTRSAKQRAGGACERCGRNDVTLEAAHVHGRERKAIVAEVLERYRAGDGFHIGDLYAFEQEIITAHEPIDETFLFLCHDCHMEYDAIERSAMAKAPIATSNAEKEAVPEQAISNTATYKSRCDGITLPIELIPANKHEFNRAFLASGKAEIREIHEDGNITVLPWIAKRYKSTSDPINNLRSKARYRQGVWQELRIAKLVVEVIR